ncbi:unnamed protein product [Brassica oleracea var. botrytis]|uniref:Uncharacterized protein n=1 Tax=Brassica oleracea TaxID=3712 RepID=A0A3P6BE86_BRAOL|nr:unnamed protein product [Brassica oleracea]
MVSVRLKLSSLWSSISGLRMGLLVSFVSLAQLISVSTFDLVRGGCNFRFRYVVIRAAATGDR